MAIFPLETGQNQQLTLLCSEWLTQKSECGKILTHTDLTLSD